MTSRRRRTGLTALLALAAMAIVLFARSGVSAAEDEADPVRAIACELNSPCCGAILCDHNSEVALAMKAYIAAELEAGKDKETIEAALVAKYGEVVLGAPKARGFNLVVWVAPIVATLLGFGIAAMNLTRWVRRRNDPAFAAARSAAETYPVSETTLADRRARAEAELRELKE